MRFFGRGARASRGESAFTTLSNDFARTDTTKVEDELPVLQRSSLEPSKIGFSSYFNLPSKAQLVLRGTNHTSSGLTAHSSSSTVSSESGDHSQAKSSHRKPAEDSWSTHSTHERLLVDTMPGANGGLKPWPSLQHNASMQDLLAAGMERPRMPAASSTADARQYILREFSDSSLRAHYDPARQMPNISQQTSASAVRDMGLRKGPVLTEPETSRRPLKSAMKHGSPEEQKHRGKWGGATKKDGGRMRRLDFGHLLHRKDSSGNISVSTSLSSDQYQEKQSKQSQRRPTPQSQHKPTSSHSDPAARPKIFEKDVYDSAKVNVRRPPKGIKNWFDGFDISSDEEERPPIELPAADVLPPLRKDSHEVAKAQDHHQDDVGSLLEQPRSRIDKPYERQHRPQQSSVQTRQSAVGYYEKATTAKQHQPRPRRNASDDIVNDNMQAIEQARQQMHARQCAQNMANIRKGSAGSVDVHSLGGSTARTGGSESRLAKSKLGKESVLSLSDTSEDEKVLPTRDSVADSVGYEGTVDEASHIDLRRPVVVPRQLHGSRSYARDTFMTTQTSGSIPITLSSDPPIPLPMRRGTQDSSSEHTAAALRKLIGRSDSIARPKNGSKHTSFNPEYEDSAAGETVSSFPSEQSHMMAVSDEEMVLLEMMRLKRAAMQKNSFTEGYQQALKREQEQLTLRRQSAQKTALKILKQRKEKLREAQDRIDREGLDEEQKHRLSVLKQADVDSQAKIDRFFAMETPLENVFPEPPNRSRAGSEQQVNGPTEELLLPRTYTPQPPQPAQVVRNKVTASPLLPSPSTMRSTTNTDYNQGDDLDEVAQLEADLSRFLASDGRNESVAFPLPPETSPKDQHRKSQGLPSLLSPSLSPTEEEEEDVVFPSRSPNRSAHKQRTPSPRPQNATTGSRTNNESSVLFSPSTPGGDFPESVYAATPDAKRGTYTSIISSYQTHHRNEHVPDVPTLPTTNPSTVKSVGTSSRAPSPSLSTSRASPLTPTFAPAALQPQSHNLDIAGSDNPSPRTYASSDQSIFRVNKSLRLEEHPEVPPRSQARKKKAPLPPPIQTLSHESVYGRTNGRVGSVGSYTSASEDVLAAWAELGGGSEGFTTRSKGRLHAY